MKIGQGFSLGNQCEIQLALVQTLRNVACMYRQEGKPDVWRKWSDLAPKRQAHGVHTVIRQADFYRQFRLQWVELWRLPQRIDVGKYLF